MPGQARRLDPKLLYISGAILVAATLTVIAMVFFVSSPTVFQYRIAILLLSFALSTVSAVLFATKAEISGKIGVIAVTIVGPGALWVAVWYLIGTVFPESAIQAPISYRLHLNLIFPENDPPNPFSESVRVRAFVQPPDGPAEEVDTSRILIRGVGGLVVNFDDLKIGDKLYLLTEDGEKKWRSDDVVTPSAHLQMNSIAVDEP